MQPDRRFGGSDLLGLVRELTPTADWAETTRLATRALTRALGADTAGAYRVDRTGGFLEAIGGYRVPKQFLPLWTRLAIPITGHAFVEEAFRCGRPAWSDHAQDDPRIHPGCITHFPVRSMLLVPLCADGTSFGAIWLLWWEEARSFADPELDLVESAARQAALAIRGAELLRETERQRQASEQLGTVAAEMGDSLDSHVIASAIVDSLCKLFGTEIAVVFEIDRLSEDLVAIASRGPEGHPRLRKGTGLSAIALREGRAVASVDLLADPRVTYDQAYLERLKARGLGALLAVPLRTPSGVIGTLTVGGPPGRVFAEADLDLAGRFAVHAAFALERARRHSDLRAVTADLENRQRRLEALLETSRDLAGLAPPEELLKGIAARARELLEAGSVVIRLAGPEGLTVAAAAGDAERLEVPRRFGADQGLPGLVAAGGAPVLIEDLAKDPRVRLEHLPTASALGYRSYLGVPLRAGEQILGVLSLWRGGLRPFQEQDQALAAALAEHAALALLRADLLRDKDQRVEELRGLHEFAQAIASLTDISETYGRLTRSVADFIGAGRCLFALYDRRERRIVGQRPGHGVSDELVDEIGGPAGAAGSGWGNLTKRGPVVVNSTAEVPPDLRDFAVRHGLECVAAVPLRTGGQVTGILYCADKPGGFQPRDVHLLEVIAAHAAVAIQNAQRYTELRETRDFLESIARHSADGIVTTDLGGTITYVSPGAEAMFGYRAEEAIGRPVTSFTDEAWQRLPLAERLVAEGHQTEEVRARRKDGRWLLVSGSLSLIHDGDGRPTGALGIFRDHTDRRRAEEALAQSEERYRSIVEGSIQGMWIHQGFVIRFANGAAARMLGYGAPGEMVGRDIRDHFAPRDRARVEGYGRARIRREAAPERFQAEFVRTDGKPIWLEVVASLGRWEGAPAVIAACVDVTQQKELETQLAQAQKMEAVGRLAGGVAHDFNNLLTVISGRSQVALERLPDDQRARKDLELISQTAHRAGALTQQLLAFSRKQVIAPRPLDLDQLALGLGKLLRRVIGEDIELHLGPSPEGAWVHADPTQLEQVLLNLAVNARDAMPAGGRLTIETRLEEQDPKAAKVRGLQPGPRAVLVVSDSGVGMDADTRERIFEPFFTTKAPGEGTGLGLSTVYGIVAQHGGGIEVESEPGRGTTFRISLPRIAPPIPADPTDLEPRARPRGSETILVVEDDEQVRELVSEVLRDCGYSVVVPGDVQEAMALAERHRDRIDLLLTDVVMPGLSGRQLAERLTAARPDLKVLYMSGYTYDILGRQGVLDAGVALLHKPFTPDVVARRVREALDGREPYDSPVPVASPSRQRTNA